MQQTGVAFSQALWPELPRIDRAQTDHALNPGSLWSNAMDRAEIYRRAEQRRQGDQVKNIFARRAKHRACFGQHSRQSKSRESKKRKPNKRQKISDGDLRARRGLPAKH